VARQTHLIFFIMISSPDFGPNNSVLRSGK
jgi:hypothetical protein